MPLTPGILAAAPAGRPENGTVRVDGARYCVCIMTREGYTVKYSLSTSEIPWDFPRAQAIFHYQVLGCIVCTDTGLYCTNRYWPVLYVQILACIVLPGTSLCCTYRYWPVLYYQALVCIVRTGTGLYCITMYWAVLYYKVLACIVLTGNGLYCTTRYWPVLYY